MTKNGGAAPERPAYRYDLDGLRGVAIGLVVLFHVFVGRVSGGVDVFLLLSGYFFVGSQLRYADRPDASLNPWWPLWRTARRLVPSLALVLGATTVAVAVLAPVIWGADFVNQVAASALYFQNWMLNSQDEAYGEAAFDASPLQHVWSMSVQGQFYVLVIAFVTVIAALVRALRRRGRGPSVTAVAGPIIAVATAASLGYAIYLHQVDQPLNYYSTWSRLWELGLGATLGIYAKRVAPPRWLGAAMAALGVAIIAATGLLFDGADVFPGPGTLVPLGGAALVVLSGGAGAWLASKPMRWLGGIAYALYLWHWPILIVATVVAGQETPSVGLGVTVVAVSLVLADLTHRFVERPLRQHARRPAAGERRAHAALSQLRSSWPPRLRLIAGVVVAVLVAGLALLPAGWARYVAKQEAIGLDENLYPGAAAIEGAPVPEAEPQPPVSQLSMFVSDERLLGCFQDHNAGPLPVPIEERQKEDPNACVFGDPEGDTTVVALGGSHTQQWLPALNELGAANGVRIIPLTRSQCPPVLPVEGESFQDNCYTFNEIALDRIASWEPDLVLTTGTRPFNRGGHPRELVPLSYIAMWNALKDIGVPVALLRDNPWMYDANEETWNPSVCEAEGGSEEFCGIPAEYFYQDEDPAEEYVWNVPGFETIDTREWFCPDGFCPPVIGNLRVYFDSNHVEHRYAETLAPLLWGQFEPIIEAAAEPGLRAAMLLSAPIPEPDDALIDDPGARRPGSPLPRDLAGGAPPAPGEELPGNATIYPFDPSPVEVKPFEPEM